MNRIVLLGAVVGLLAGCTPSCPAPEARTASTTPPRRNAHDSPSTIEQTRLVLWITVDQMRGDFFALYGHHISAEGFGRLLDHGLSYTAASHRHAITETAPGHATLFTGAAPREHGIIGNSWLLEDGSTILSVSDPQSPLLGPGAPDAAEESQGRSPRLLLLPTVGDEMVRQSEGRARIVSVSLKDRGAILPAGQTGDAFWLGERGFVTSKYYFDEAPKWLNEHHANHLPGSYLPGRWTLAREEDAYRMPPASVPPSPGLLGEGFPHELPDESPVGPLLKVTPFGDLATLDLARSALLAEELGSDDVVDLLAVSLSSTDGIGHAFGPTSREAEDNFARLDRALAQFFDFLDERIGWDHVLVVLSSDHGGAEPAEMLEGLGLRGGRLTEGQLEAHAREAARSLWGQDLVLGVSTPYVWLDRRKLETQGRDLAEARESLAREVASLPGVYAAYPSAGELPVGRIADGVLRSLHPERSGDVYVVTSPYTLLLQDEDLTATHGSPWAYDAHVPLVIAGPGVPRGQVSRSADTRSLAGTVAALLGLTPPPGAKPALLVEALQPHFARGSSGGG